MENAHCGSAGRPEKFHLLTWILLSAGVLYLINTRRTLIGCFADDARDLLAAKSLLQGHYVSLMSPDRPPLNLPLPGFPLFLAPFLALFGDHWTLVKIIPIAATLTSGALFSSLMEGLVQQRIRIILLFLFLFNPLTLFLSTLVISDTFFVSLILAVFWSMKNLIMASSYKMEWGLGFLMAAMSMVRPEGLLLTVAVCASLLSVKRYRPVPAMLIPTILIGIAWLGRNYRATGQLSGYSSDWRMSLESLSRTTLLVHHWSHMMVTWFWEIMLGISFGETRPWWMALAALAGGVLAVWGFLSWLKEAKSSRGLVLAIGLFSAAFMGLHAVWLSVHPHYFFPMLPFSLLFFAKVWEEGKRQRPGMMMIGALGLTLVGSAYAVQDYYQAFSAAGIALENQVPTSTLTWIKNHVPKDPKHIILAARAPTVTLYTQCYSRAYVPGHNVEQFRFELLTNKISHVLWEPVPIMFVAVPGASDPIENWHRTASWLASWPAAFHPVFHNENERTEIYEIEPSPTFLKAYQQYREASQSFATGQVQDGMRKIEEALKIDPELTSALNGYAAAVLQFGGPLDRAESRLREAIRLRPDFDLARLNLARIDERRQSTKRID